MRFTKVLAICVLIATVLLSICSASDNDDDRLRVIITVAPGMMERGRSFILNRGDVTFVHEFLDLNVIAAEMPHSLYDSMQQTRDSSILQIELDEMNYPHYHPDDINTATIHHRSLQGEVIPYGVPMVQAQQAWNSGYTGRGITVCIIDSGLDADHEDHRDVDKSGFSITNENWNVDTCSHGTHVAGTVAATRNNGVGIVGVAPNVRLIIAEVFESSGGRCGGVSTSDTIAAARRCQEDGADIINMSLGSIRGAQSWESEAYESLRSQGVLVVASAGNSGTTSFNYPASYDAVVSVGAIDSDKDLYSGSQRNSQVDFAAPGVSVLSTTNGNNYQYFTGTSMASPHVAGVAALVWSSNILAGPEDVLLAMELSAQDLGSFGRDDSYGHGLVKARDAVFSLTSSVLVDSVDSARATCFSADVTAVVEGKGNVPMKDIAVGNKVLTASGQYKTIFSITHYHPTKPANFLQVHTKKSPHNGDDETSNNTVELSPSHMIFVDGKTYPVPALELKVGDKVQSLYHGPQEVIDIHVVSRHGLYNPLTTDGTIVVTNKGIIASTYTSFTGTANIDIAGYKLWSIQSLLDMTVYPYRAICMNGSLDFCNQHGEDELSTVVDFIRQVYITWLQQHVLVQWTMLALYLVCLSLINLMVSPCGILIVAGLWLQRCISSRRTGGAILKMPHRRR